MTPRARALLATAACALVLPAPGCVHRARLPQGAQEIVVPPPPVATAVDVERVTPLGDADPVIDDRCSCAVDVPPGWAAFRVDGQRGDGIRLVRDAPPPMTVDVWFGADHVPEDAAAFFDRGPYLGESGRLDTVAVWTLTDMDRPGGRRFGALLQRGRQSVVVDGWIPEEEFEAGKRAFDAIVAGISLDMEGSP